MDIEYHTDGIPERLLAQLNTGRRGVCFRRRAVMTKTVAGWELVCCTIEKLPPRAAPFEPTSSRQYPQVLLREDLLTEQECLEFATQVQAGGGRIGDCELAPGQTPQWQSQLVPVNNDYMATAGLVVGVRNGRRSAHPQFGPLLVPDQPYYPDLDEASRDWLPFTKYHGHTDGRNDQILFLLPETRAFIASAEFAEPSQLVIMVAGTEVDTRDLLVKGAFWESGAIRHFEQAVGGSKATVPVAKGADRLEYYLLDRAGTAFDFHQEDRMWRSHTGNAVLGGAQRSLEAQVREALTAGEGLKIEFKPFVDPEMKRAPGAPKSKLDEIATTAVAFANTQGGHIYLGVNDDCEAAGIEAKLCEWAKASCTEAVIARYLGAMNSRIKSLVLGEITLELSHVRLDDALIGVIQVLPAINKPLAIHQDHHLYARSGASNRKVPPDQWRAVLEPIRPSPFQ